MRPSGAGEGERPGVAERDLARDEKAFGRNVKEVLVEVASDCSEGGGFLFVNVLLFSASFSTVVSSSSLAKSSAKASSSSSDEGASCKILLSSVSASMVPSLLWTYLRCRRFVPF